MTDLETPIEEADSAGKTQTLNDRTFQEVEYLKKNLGPILVASLADICIRRPADPIDFLGHWLLRWRYNEELKRRDIQNTLEVVKQKAWTKDDEQSHNAQNLLQGFVPGSTNAPPGFGGPLDASALAEKSAEAAPVGEPATVESTPAEEPPSRDLTPAEESAGETPPPPEVSASEEIAPEEEYAGGEMALYEDPVGGAPPAAADGEEEEDFKADRLSEDMGSAY